MTTEAGHCMIAGPLRDIVQRCRLFILRHRIASQDQRVEKLRMMSFNNLQPQNGDLCDICSTIPLKCFVEDGAKFNHYRSRDDLERSASNGCPLCFIIQVADEATDTWFPIHERGDIDDLRYWGRSAGPFHLKVEARESENLKLSSHRKGIFLSTRPSRGSVRQTSIFWYASAFWTICLHATLNRRLKQWSRRLETD